MRSSTEFKHPLFWLWFALLVPAGVWMIHLNVNFMVAAYACENNLFWVLRLFNLLVVGVTLLGIWGGWKSFRHFKEHGEKDSFAFLALMAILLAGLLLMVELTSELSFMLEPCL